MDNPYSIEISEGDVAKGIGGSASVPPPQSDTAVAPGLYRREMDLGEAIDITFDFRSDTPPRRDPDALIAW